MDNTTQLFLRHCKAESIKHTIGTKSSQKRWKSRVGAWHKAITTTPSGQYLGHFKALVRKQSMPLDTDKEQELSDKQNELVDAHTWMLQYALDKRYSYIRWQNIVNTIIGKEVGNNKINRNRILSIYEADYSVFIGLMWKTYSSPQRREAL
eukprot:15366453-Ditylum_brightwellii.AAC.1